MNNQPEQNKEISAEQFLWNFIMTKTGIPETDILSIEELRKESSFSKMVEMLIEYRSLLSKEVQQSDAVEFAEWVGKNGWTYRDKDIWDNFSDATDKTTAELYKIYDNSNSTRTGKRS